MSRDSPLLRYHVLTPARHHADGGDSVGRGSPLGAAIELAPVVLEMINKGLIAWRVRSCLRDLEARIAQAMPSRGGVLLVYTTQWWEHPDLGTRVEHLVDPPAIAGIGSSARDTFERWVRQPRFTRGAPQGWKLSRHFLWTTR